MSKKKNTNPNRVPVSKADINKAKNQATSEAMNRIVLLMLFILIDKHDAPQEDVQQLAGEINYYADSISRGYVKWKDIEQVVVKEYGVELPW